MELSEQIYTDLTERLPQLKEALVEGAQWGTELAGRYIWYDIAIHIMYVCIEVAVIALAVFAFRKCLKKATDYESGWYFWAAMSIFVFVVMVCCAATDFAIILKDIFIPEIRIMELLSNLIT